MLSSRVSFTAALLSASCLALGMMAIGLSAPNYRLSAQPTVVTPGPGAALVVADTSLHGAVRAWWRTSNGNIPSSWSITGSNTFLFYPRSLAVDAAGELWVGNDGTPQVTIFAHGVSGNVAPAMTIDSPKCYSQFPGSLRISSDATGNVYLLVRTAAKNAANDCILVYQSGTTTVLREIDIPNVNDATDLVVSGTKVYVVDYLASAVYGYSTSSSGKTPPSFTLTGSKTGIQNPMWISADPVGDLFLSGMFRKGVYIFRSGVSGNNPPTHVVNLPASGGGAIVAGKWTFVVVTASNNVPQLSTYRDSDPGPTPFRLISGSRVRLVDPNGLLLD